jgi:hypothetical protein
VTELHVFDAPDGLEAWLAVSAFIKSADSPRTECSVSPDVFPGRTDNGTGGNRPHRGKHASSQVAPTSGPPVAGGLEVSTKTCNEDLNTKTDDEDQDHEDVALARDLRSGQQSPVPVGRRARGAGQDPDSSPPDTLTRDGTEAERRRQADALTKWMRDQQPQAAP